MNFRFTLPLFLFIFLGSGLFSDRIETRHGSIVYGTIEGIEDGNLTIETDFAGTLKIPTSELKSLSSNSNLGIRTDTNATFFGQSIPTESGQLSVRNQNKTNKVSFAEIHQLWQVSTGDPVTLEQIAEEESLRMKWENSLGFDLSGASGNTDNLAIGLRLDSVYSNKIRELDMYLSFVKTEQNKITNSEETKYGAEYDSLFLDYLAWYLKQDFEHDPVEHLDIRSTTAIGIKYDWIEEENYQVATRLGSAFRYEKISQPSSSTKEPALDLGLDYSHLINKVIGFESSLSFVPILDDADDYVFQHDTALILPLAVDESWQLRTGLSGTYDSTPGENLKESDIRYYLRVNYLFQ